MQTNSRRFVVSVGLLLFEPEVRAWQGLTSLARVFWLYGVLMSLGIGTFYLLAAEADRVGMQQVLLIGFAIHTCWLVVAIWRCAERAQPGWRALSRGLTVAWALNAMMVTVFLELDLMVIALGT